MDKKSYREVLPNPPIYKSSKKSKFEVPNYYSYDHPCTKWLLACMVSNNALDRIIKCRSNHDVLKRIHQIPDLPNVILKTSNRITDDPAYNRQAILYLRPFSLAIYTKYEDALIKLTNLNDKNGIPLVDPCEINYVHNFWRKGETRYFSDLSTSCPAILAIRRNYFKAFKYLLKLGYQPNAKFKILYRKSHRKLILPYKDILDFAIDYLKSHPAFNTSQLMHILLSSANSLNIMDVFCFDLINDNRRQITNGDIKSLISMNKKPISLFQRIAQNALEFSNISGESGMQILNILCKIQEAGYFTGLPLTKSCNVNAKKMSLSELISNNNQTCKLYLKDLQCLSVNELKELLENDYKCCISFLMKWLQDMAFKRKTNQNLHLLNLLIRVLFDTNFIKLLFRGNISSDADLLQQLSEFPFMHNYLTEPTVYNIRLHANLMFKDNVQLATAFSSRFKCKSTDLLLSAEQDQIKCLDGQNVWLLEEEFEYNFRKHYLQRLTNQSNKYYRNQYFINDELNTKSYNDESLQTDDLLTYENFVVKSKRTYIFEEKHEFYSMNGSDDASKSLPFDTNSDLLCSNSNSVKDKKDSFKTIEVDMNGTGPNDDYESTITQMTISSLNDDIKHFCTNNANISQFAALNLKNKNNWNQQLNQRNPASPDWFNIKSKPPPLIERRRNIIKK